MTRHDARTVGNLVELRRKREERLTEELGSAAASLHRARDAEAVALGAVRARDAELAAHEERCRLEITGAYAVASLAEQAAFRARLAADLERAAADLAHAVEGTRSAEADHDRIRTALARAAAERVAAERHAKRIRKQASLEAESRLDEEMMEVVGSRLHRGEDE